QLSLQAHQHVAVVGTAGSGKTTLAMLLARLYAYNGTVLLDSIELAQLPSLVAGRQIAYVGSEPRLFTGTVLENLVYGLRHRPAGANGAEAAPDPTGADEWLDLAPVGAADRSSLVASVLEATRLVGLEDDLFAFGLRTTIDPARRPEIASRLLTARRLVAQRLGPAGGEPVAEVFDRDRFAADAWVGE